MVNHLQANLVQMLKVATVTFVTFQQAKGPATLKRSGDRWGQEFRREGWTETAIIQRVPALHVFWDLEKTVLHETRVSGTVLWSPTNANSPTYTNISQKTC